MLGFISTVAALTSLATAQQVSFAPGTGVRSLWIPFQTVDGTPLASIAGRDEVSNQTTYVLSCPTASPQCAIAPNLTLTEGISMARYSTSNSAGDAVFSCAMTGTTSVTCAVASGDTASNVRKTTSVLSPSQIVFQAVDVTQTLNNTSTMPVTVTVSAQTTTSSTSSSTAGAQTSGGPWAMGGAVGAGLIALAAL